MIRSCTLAILTTLFLSTASAQYTRQIIAFTDKNETSGTLANPSAYLSAKAVERRTRYNIAVDSTDLPITKRYLDSIASVPGVTILNRSKWLNQVLVRITDPNALTKINSFPFVRSSTAIAPRIATDPSGRSRKSIIEDNGTPIANVRQQNVEGVELDYGSSLNQIRIHKGEYLHNLGFTGQSITFAVLDAGFRNYTINPALDSMRLQGRLLGEWDYVANHASVTEDDAHGSNCLTIIAANRPGLIVGSAPHSRFWLLRTEDVSSEYPVEEQNWAAAAEFADSAGVDMISSSLGYRDFDNPAFDYTHAERDGNTAISTRAADLAAKKGIIVMNSAGNDGSQPGEAKFIACPADGDSVMTVGAVDANGNIAGFSSWGPNGAGKQKPNIVSVGQGTIYAHSISGGPVSGNGTSYSNPNAAGLIACFWQAFPELSNMQIIDVVQKSSNRYNNPDVRYGYGLPDFRKAFLTVLKDRATFDASLNGNECKATITWTSKDKSGMHYLLQRRLPNDTGFITIETITSNSADFRTRNYVETDDLLDFTGAVQYRVMQAVSADTLLQIGGASLMVTTACPSASEPAVVVTPNPTTNNVLRLTITASSEMVGADIVIIDMKGRVVKRMKRSIARGVSRHEISISGLMPGVYVVKAYYENKETFTTKFIK